MTINWSEQPWKDLIPRWQLFTMGHMYRRLYWRGSCCGKIPGGKEADDFIYEAIEKVMTGTRNWNPQKVSLYQVVIGIIKSDIHHYVTSRENSFREADETSVLNITDYRRPPDSQIEYFQIITTFINYLNNKEIDKNQPKLGILAKLILQNHIVNPIDLAKKLSIPVNQVNNLKKRLKRAAIKFGEQFYKDKNITSENIKNLKSTNG